MTKTAIDMNKYSENRATNRQSWHINTMTVKPNIPKREALITITTYRSNSYLYSLYSLYPPLSPLLPLLSLKVVSTPVGKLGTSYLPLMLTVANKSKLLEPCWGNKLRRFSLG